MASMPSSKVQDDVEVIDLTNLSLSPPATSTRESPREMLDDASVPWYQDPDGAHPFVFSAKTRAPQISAAAFIEAEYFPWGNIPLERLWDGDVYASDDIKLSWPTIAAKWKDVLVTCGGKIVRLIDASSQRQGVPLFQITLPDECQFHVSHVKWALNPRNLHPLLIYVHSSVLHLFDVEAQLFLGCIRGHGGGITSINVHPVHPHLVCTTSRDCTTRIYDLRIDSSTDVLQLASPAKRKLGLSLRIENDEGNCSLGKCVVILTGGRSGGHEAAVLDADFHPSLPLVVTCGMDHALRIWHLRPQLYLKDEYTGLYQEDKPLFSSTMIHDARVLFVCWLSHDLLLSRSASRTIVPANEVAAENDHGTLVVWQWLSIGRFFPADASIHRESPLRGCISDYRESASFKMISMSRLPGGASGMNVHRERDGPPIVLLCMNGRIAVFNTAHLGARPRPVLRDREDGEGVRPLKRIRLSGVPTKDMRTDMEGWVLSVAVGEDLEDEQVEYCVMSPDGKQIAAVGGREGLWIWNMAPRRFF